jgi:tetratricopeptide (TPR) repeat protein
MFTSATLISGSAANAPDGRRDIARGFKLARRWQQQGKWREAEQVYGSVLTVEPRHFGSLCGPGAVYKQQGRREEAAALFRRAAASARWRRYANQLGPLLEALETAAPHASSPSGPMAPDHV